MAPQYQLIVIGASAGGTAAFRQLLPMFPAHYPIPMVIAQHLHPMQENTLILHFNTLCNLTVKEADEKEAIKPGHVYFAPPNYHLLIESDRTFSLSVDAKVNYSRPSIDVLFECAADVYAPHLIGVVLTGANNDGAHGLQSIQEGGGLAIVQDPSTAEVAYMPQAALTATQTRHVLSLHDIGNLLLEKGK
ncbi:MAG: chemotaxis protein CheB [Anaerolineae bacterium]|nr:chemotaxis protein CheB [Anaerolineae bacterium]